MGNYEWIATQIEGYYNNLSNIILFSGIFDGN